MKKPTDEKTVLSLLDVLGSCLVDIFYNHMYDRAIAVHEKTSRGLTECYRQAIEKYLSEHKSPRFYTMLLNSLHHYVRMSTIYTDISYTECIGMYASLFVPQMYANSLTTDQRVNLLSMILNNTVHTLGSDIMQQHIGCIIDDHSDATNIEILQDAVLKMLIHERESSYDRFIRAQKKDTKERETKELKEPKAKSVVANRAVEQEALRKLNTALKKFVAERSQLKTRNSALVSKNNTLAKRFNELKAMFLKQIAIQREQAKLIAELKQQLNQLYANEKKADLERNAERNVETNAETKTEEAYMTPKDESSGFDDDLFSVQYVEDPERY